MKTTRFLLAATAFAAVASAQFTLVAPSGYAAAEGNSNNIYPWGRAASPMHYMQIYDSTHFTGQGVASPILISNLRFRADAVAATTTWAGGSWPNIGIYMSTAAVDYTAYSTTFANNHGPDLTTVLNGQVTVLPGAGNGTGIPGQWHIDIALTTPFLYDPTTGSDLALEVQLDGTGWSGTGFRCDAVSGTSMCSRMWESTSATSPTASGSSADYGLVTEFTYVPANGLYSSFSASPTSTPLNTPVNFTDHSYSSDPGGVLAWAWDVDGDSVIDYTTQNCSHSYTTEGYYDVSLTVVDSTHGSVTQTIPQYIAVDAVEASFTTMTLPGNTVVFTDTSAGTPTSWAWDVDGDSVTDYTTQNCVHPYPNPGQYNVTLTVTDAISNSTTSQELGVNVIPMPPYTSTYTYATNVRGYWFQSPTKFSITSLKVPDETMHGTQNVAVYRGTTISTAGVPNGTQELEFLSLLQPSATPIPCAISFDAGDYVCVLGACGDASIMHNSYANGGPSTVLGQPITLARLYSQVNLNAPSPETFTMIGSSVAAPSSIARVFTGVTSCAGVPYGDGTPSGAGPAAPKMRCTALPFIGQTAVLSVEQGDANVLGFLVTGLGRASVTSPYGTILVGNILATQILTPGIVGPGTYTHSWNVPNNPALVGVDVNHQYAQIDVNTFQVALSNGIEMQFAP
ncbi:MAG: PKD domain-containing protein [Planctomycetes bacterium]|nr:PKD domain-containing protein [Planctomycetota bacterium]